YSSAADMLANSPSSVSLQFGLNPYLISDWNTGFFIQDDFRVTPRLILNLGLRYEYFSVPHERDDRFFNRAEPFGFGPLIPSDQVYNADRNNFSPRLGFAWTLDSSGKTVLRGGTGVFFSRVPVRGILQLVQNGVDEPALVKLSRAEALERGVAYPVGDISAFKKVPGLPWSSPTLNPNFPNPYSIQWTLTLQRQLTRSLALETSYVGNKASKLFFTRYVGRVDRITGLRPVDGFGEMRHFDTSESTHYSAWQTSLRKSYSAGFVLNAHYTWANNISFLNGDVTTDQDGPQDLNNLANERGPASQDVRHRLVGDIVYELPFQRIWNADTRGRKLLLGGWQVAGIYTAETGLPFNPSMPNVFRNQRIDYVGGDPYLADSQSTLMYLRRSAFAAVPVIQASGATARPGTLGRNALRLPGLWNIDLTVSKSLDFTERIKFQLRAEMINALNHTNFSGLNTNITQSDFGKFTGTRGSRTIQLGGRLTF
ncbi:MAG: TonB-dependent receptor, partial [Bryobacteraceae bacterium]